MIWQKEWPTEIGLWWFYGYPYGRQDPNREIGLGDKELSLCVIDVWKISDGFSYILNGNFWGKYEKAAGMFLKIDLPELPKLPEYDFR